jgi:large subunit ribosomal protein L19
VFAAGACHSRFAAIRPFRYDSLVMDVSNLVELKDNPNVADFGPGDTVKVSAKVVEGERERTQVFEGVVIRRNNGGGGANFTVRRIASGVGVERTFNIHSPRLEKVQVVREGRVRRARLYYLRGLTGKAARIKEKARV